MNSLLATLAISVFPIALLMLVPLGNAQPSSPMLKVFLAFAVGGLLGDVFLHLIPHALTHGHDSTGHGHSHDGGHGHSHGEGAHDHSREVNLGLQILTGMFVFFLVEKFAVLQGRDHHGHGHSHGGKECDGDGHGHGQDAPKKEEKQQQQQQPAQKTQSSALQARMRISAFLNILADTAHNVTDGMAIAASFMVSEKAGYLTTFAVLCHEVPHEIGDLAILVKSGYTRTQVIFVQMFTALGALGGTVIGLFLGSTSNSGWILPFTAGGFIYISTTNVIPELFEDTNLLQTLAEVVALLMGVGAMIVVGWME